MEFTVKEQLEMVMQQMNELTSIYQAAVGQSGISENEFWVWYILILTDGEHSQQDICNTWSFSKQTINTVIRHMVEKGYAVLEVVPGTRNRKNILLTEAGRQYGESVVMPIANAEQRTLDRMDYAELAACTAALGKYIKTLKEEIGNEKTEAANCSEK